MKCAAAGCNEDAVGVYCGAHGAAKTDEERRRDGDERRDRRR